MRVTFERVGCKTYLLTGEGTDRWAKFVKRDSKPRDSYLLTRSDGVMVGGELNFWWTQNWMLRWVGEGR